MLSLTLRQQLLFYNLIFWRIIKTCLGLIPWAEKLACGSQSTGVSSLPANWESLNYASLKIMERENSKGTGLQIALPPIVWDSGLWTVGSDYGCHVSDEKLGFHGNNSNHDQCLKITITSLNCTRKWKTQKLDGKAFVCEEQSKEEV